MSDLTWEYPIVLLFAIALGAVLFHFLTRHEQEPLPMDFERHCPRCKLRTTGKAARDFIYCPFCASRYPPLS